MIKAWTISGDIAVIPGETAAILTRLLGTWTRSSVNLTNAENRLVAEAVLALQDAAALHRTSTSRRGSGEVTWEAAVGNVRWMKTAEVAEAVGLCPRRIRQLYAADVIRGRKTRGELEFAPDSPALINARRGRPR